MGSLSMMLCSYASMPGFPAAASDPFDVSHRWQFRGWKNGAGCGVWIRSRASKGLCGTRRRLEAGTPRAEAGRREEEGLPEREEVNGRATLSKLDDQLRSLSSSSNTAASAAREARGMQAKQVKEKEDKVEWPIFSDGFLVYAGIGLLLLTVVNNIAFRVFLGPPVSNTKKPTAPARPRYRLRSRNEVTSLDAPPLVDSPLINTQ